MAPSYSVRLGDGKLQDARPRDLECSSSPSSMVQVSLGVLGCEVDLLEVGESGLTEPVPLLGVTLLHTIGRFPAHWLRDEVGQLEPDRHQIVASRIRNLIAPVGHTPLRTWCGGFILRAPEFNLAINEIMITDSRGFAVALA